MINEPMPLVDENDGGIRPAGKPDECFYCQQKVGQPHKYDCVCVTKKVKVKCTIEYEIEVPHFWTKEQIEFHRNLSSWCSDNLIDELQEISDSGNCLCNSATFEYLETTNSKPFRKLRK